MKAFVTGGPGVIGKRAVPALVSDGHEISVVSRDDVKDELVRQLGGSPVCVDLFDEAAVKAAVEGHEAVINLATNIPPMSPTSKMSKPSNWATNDRLCSEASGYLVDAALVPGAIRLVQESIAFPYVDSGEAWVDETFDGQTTEATASADVAEPTCGGSPTRAEWASSSVLAQPPSSLRPRSPWRSHRRDPRRDHTTRGRVVPACSATPVEPQHTRCTNASLMEV